MFLSYELIFLGGIYNYPMSTICRKKLFFLEMRGPTFDARAHLK